MNLYAHQQKIIDEDSKKTGLFLGTGSGKTITALVLARGHILVIAPKTQVEDRNWERAFEDITHIGSLTVISKERFRRDYETIGKFDTVIIDEAHTCLGVTPTTRQRKRQIIPRASQLFEALDSYLHFARPERLYLCTATIMRSPMTVWAAYKLLKPDGVGANIEGFYEFRRKYYTQLPMPGRDVWTPKNDNQSKDDLADMVRLLGYVGRLEDFFDVPEQSFKVDHVELTEAQKKEIKKAKLEWPEPIVQVGKRHQIENGVLTGDEYTMPKVFPNAKIEKILEYALEFPRMVIFCRYRAQIDHIESALKGYKVLTLTGDTKDRGAVLADANASPECVFIAQCQVSAGWELPEYPVMIFASCDYSFVNYDQAIGRIQRANNIKRNLYISLVVKGGVDEAVAKSLANKQDFAERLYLDSQ